MILIFVFLVLLYTGLQIHDVVRQRPRSADLAQARNFPLPGIAAALAEKEGMSLAEAQRLESEFRRWFVVAAASRVPIGMASKEVDGFWHALLEQPALYEKFSRAVAGRVIVHLAGVYDEVLNARAWLGYEQIWHAAPPADLWPRPSEAALLRVRASIRRSRRDSGGADGSGDVNVSLDVSGASSGHDSHHAGIHGDSGGHSHGSDGGGHGCGGGH